MPKSKPRLCGRWNPDPNEHADYHGRRICRTCNLPGRAGDSHHPKAPASQDHEQLDITQAWAHEEARRLGERGND